MAPTQYTILGLILRSPAVHRDWRKKKLGTFMQVMIAMFNYQRNDLREALMAERYLAV